MNNLRFEPMADILQEGEKDGVTIKHLVVTEAAAKFEQLRASFKGYTPVEPGTLTQLYIGNTMMMSDAPDEKRSNSGFMYRATGDVLIAGLGLGMVLVPVLKKEDVTSVTVIELNRGVIDLVEPHIRKHVGKKNAAKLTVIHADALKWKPQNGAKWDTIYFDIWPHITLDNLPDITVFKRRFAKRLKRKPSSYWMFAWQEDALRYQQQQNRRYGYEPGFRCGTFR